MNLLTWNCNMAFRKKFMHVLDDSIDIAVIQECEHKEKLEIALADTPYNDIIWYGNNKHKGIAVISFNDVHVTLSKNFNTEFEYILPIDVSVNNTHLNLFAIWAMPHKTERRKRYVGQIWGAINYYKKAFESPSILIGDFNSNAIWDKEHKNGNHSDVVSFLDDFGISSLYHELKEEVHGTESEPTIYLLKQHTKPYHLDYCFISKTMLSNQTTIEIGGIEEWLEYSDHMPLFVKGLNLI